MNSIRHYVIDNDHNGKTGRGSLFGLDVMVNGVTTTHKWFLLDSIEGKINIKKLTDEASKLIAAEQQEREAATQQQKQSELKAREAKVVVSDALSTVVAQVIGDVSYTKSIKEFKGGKEKALNSLVGGVIKLIREQQLNIAADAFAINIALKQALS